MSSLTTPLVSSPRDAVTIIVDAESDSDTESSSASTWASAANEDSASAADSPLVVAQAVATAMLVLAGLSASVLVMLAAPSASVFVAAGVCLAHAPWLAATTHRVFRGRGEMPGWTSDGPRGARLACVGVMTNTAARCVSGCRPRRDRRRGGAGAAAARAGGGGSGVHAGHCRRPARRG